MAGFKPTPAQSKAINDRGSTEDIYKCPSFIFLALYTLFYNA